MHTNIFHISQCSLTHTKSQPNPHVHVTTAALKLKESTFNRLSLAPNTLSQQRKHDELGQELQKIEVRFRLEGECGCYTEFQCAGY